MCFAVPRGDDGFWTGEAYSVCVRRGGAVGTGLTQRQRQTLGGEREDDEVLAAPAGRSMQQLDEGPAESISRAAGRFGTERRHPMLGFQPGRATPLGVPAKAFLGRHSEVSIVLAIKRETTAK